MANVQEQMLQLLENEELPYADDASASIARTRRIPKSKKFFPQESRNLLEAYKPEIKQQRLSDTLDKNIDTSKKISTGLITGTAALPSEAVDVSNMVNDFMAKYGNNPTAMVMKQLFNNAQKDMGREAFDKWFLKTTGIKSDLTNVDQLVGEFLSPTGTILAALKAIKPIGKVGKYLYDEAKTLFTNASGGDGGSLVSANNAPIKATDETSKLLDKTKTTKPIETNIPALPSASELANKPIINPTIIGTQTETGRKAEAIYDDLVKQGINDPTIIFKKTGGGYVGRDGKFRFDLDDRDAVLKKDPNDFKFDVDSDGNTLKTKTITLNNLLKYPSLYKEYFQKLNIEGKNFDALKNIKVVLNYADSTKELSGTTAKTMGFYSFNGDSIQLNMKNLIDPMKNTQQQSDSIMSTLIHEVQHAVQHRETFANGTSPFDTKNIILDAIDKDELFTTERGIRNPNLKRNPQGDIIGVIEMPVLSRETMINNMSGSTIYSEAESLASQIKNSTSTNKYISLGDQVADNIINFPGDRKFEFLKDYEALLDSKNSLDLTKNNYRKYISTEKLSEREATMHVALDIFERIGNNRAQKAFGFKTKDDFLNFYFDELETMDDLRKFINTAYDKARVNINLSDDVLLKIENDQKRRLKDNIAILNFKDRVDYEAMLLYSDEYGEMEARLVEQRYKRRQELLRDSNLYTDKQITEKMLEDTSDIFKEPDRFGRTTETLGGFNKRNQGGLQLAKGGTTMNMNRQMEMFEEGGLKDEGGTIDPVSGNDVPSGSTQEEVRDDIPAQLSEGEFVFPADVTRFIGLEKLMQIRDEAKAGLQRMEDMGQMGNSEEATIPDGVPFSMDDLDMEDDDDGTVEMAQGGVINAATGTFVDNTSNITSTPSQFAGQNLPSQQNNPNAQSVSYTPPTYNNVQDGGFSPTYFNQLTPASDNVSTFTDLVGNNYGQYDEMRKYRSESGMVLSIPFKAGQPIYPIPEGYTYIDPEEVVEKAPVVQSVAPTTTRVVEQDDGEPGDGGGGAVDLTGSPYSIKSGLFQEKDALDKIMGSYATQQLSLFDIKSAVGRGFSKTIDVGKANLQVAKDAMTILKTKIWNGIEGAGGNPAFNLSGSNFNLVELPQNVRDQMANSLNVINGITNSVLTVQDGKERRNITVEELKNKAKVLGVSTVIERAGTNVVKDKKIVTLAKEVVQAQIKQNEENTQAQASYEKSMQDSGGGDYSGYDTGDGGAPDAYDDPNMNKGGLAGKKKSKTKKMKQGGLASRK